MPLKYKIFLSTLGQWIFFGSIIGLVVGTTTNFLLEINDFLGDDIRAKRDWLIFLLPFGGIAIGYIYMKYGKVYSNNTLNDTAELNNLVIDAVHGKKEVPKRMGPIIYLGTFITVLFGGSTGREGAAIQMGSSVSATVNKFFKVNNNDKKLLIMSGISAGFGAAFGAPIAGTVFGMEMAALGKLRFEALVPCFVASFVAYYITTAAWGHEHENFIIKLVPEFTIVSFLKVIFVSVIFALISVLYSQLRHGVQKYSEKLSKKNHMKRAFWGGVIIVVLTLIVGSQDYNGRGLEMLEQSFEEKVPPFAFLAKLVFTVITLGSGFVGGEAIPLFFIGATLGNTLHTFIDLPMSFLVAIGLIATFCGGANTPLAAFLLAMEMFNGKGLEYFFVACIVSYLFSGHHGLWPSQKIFEPKSRLYNVPRGETIENVEKKKTGG
ncbi:voltage-gated chloride channel protein [Lottiidibacillus patelloidae]|uniref:Voltage-gated chloride channel protein n=1 Tax=Lottiidibacillus patelloidae TaxID=2670334 RepID=A0A263BSW9_9BACI|nr:chloride channel protein [Lottiidibacillus patelloidae]OZM56804.1 voltage-gated chloride channel protein [Lottiidibacillus patelloidae]